MEPAVPCGLVRHRTPATPLCTPGFSSSLLDGTSSTAGRHASSPGFWRSLVGRRSSLAGILPLSVGFWSSFVGVVSSTAGRRDLCVGLASLLPDMNASALGIGSSPLGSGRLPPERSLSFRGWAASSVGCGFPHQGGAGQSLARWFFNGELRNAGTEGGGLPTHKPRKPNPLNRRSQRSRRFGQAKIGFALDPAHSDRPTTDFVSEVARAVPCTLV